MENAVAKPNTHRREEKLWSEIKSYQVANCCKSRSWT